MTEPVIVVGGGLVGLSCAWFLRAAGAEVTVLEKGRPGGGASRGNAGAICPSMADPLPAPGMIREALANLPRPDAALHVSPMYAPRMAGFLRRFAQAATRDRYEAGLAALAQLGRDVIPAYDELAAAGIGTHAERAGYLFVHRDRGAAREEREAVSRMASMGLCAEPGDILDPDELRELEPLLSDAVQGGFVLPDERWIDPSMFVDDLAEGVREAGVKIVECSGAERVRSTTAGAVAETVGDAYEAGTVVLAAGVWTKDLTARLGLKLQMYPGKGYSFAVRPDPLPERLLYFGDAHVIGARMGDRFRVAGTMEFDGTTDRFNRGRVEAIVRGLQPLLDGVDLAERDEEWVGPRPVTPDGLPYLGRVPGHENVVLAAGHNMLGLTLAPPTGRAIAGLVTADDPGIDLAPFDPARFG
jgi:D-amino-acid dehydrogenase